MDWPCDSCWCWVICLIICYKTLDWLVRLPFLRGRQNRYILVTGCDTGFGHEIAKRLDASGCHVFAGCLTEKGATGLKAECSSCLVPLIMDVTDPESVKKARKEVETKLPPGKGIWGLVNNAGVLISMGPIEWRSTVADYRKQLEVNLLGGIDVTVTFLPLVKREKGRIVNMSSVTGRVAVPNYAPYCVSKHGVEAFSDTLRKELRVFGCSVHIIEPGGFKTNLSMPPTPVPSAWEQASEEVKSVYGDDYSDQAISNINRMNQYACSDRISDVVDAYEHALLGMFPRGRYVVGKDARFFWIPLQWLPEWLGDWLQDLLLRIGRPIPASLRDKKVK